MPHILNRSYSLKNTVKVSKFTVPDFVPNHLTKHFNEIIDVRTPDEFALDHIPGSVNLPVLNNDERVLVGTLYKSNSFEARKVGAAITTRNISEHLENHFNSKSSDYQPLIYCWRGGQRSYSMGLVLAQIGFKTSVLEGGYKQYRKQVQEELSALPGQFQYIVIAGLTGSGKTQILDTLRKHGEQVLDLEALAKHKGSLLGLWHGEKQPSQKMWESILLKDLRQFSSNKPIWVESESQRIGFVSVPQTMFDLFRLAPRYSITLPMQERVKHILRCYPNWVEDKGKLKETISPLVKVRGHKIVDQWMEQIDKGEWEDFVRCILEEHYDPSYIVSQRKNNLSSIVTQNIDIPDLNKETLDTLASELINLSVRGFTPPSFQNTLHIS